MQHYEIYAYTTNEAKQKAYELYDAVVIRDYTKSWNKVKTRDSDPVLFVSEKMLIDDLFSEPGAAALVQCTPIGKAKRFFKPIKYKRRGNIKVTRSLEIRGMTTDKLYAVCNGTVDGIPLARKLIADAGEDLYGKVIYTTEDKEFILEYNAPKKAKLGKYIIVKCDEDDLEYFTRKHNKMW